MVRFRFLKTGDVPVGGIAAISADQERIFTDGGEIHELVGQAPAHHAHIRLHREHRNTAAKENVEISLVVGAVLTIEPFHISVEAVAVFHSEFTYAD